MKQVNPNQGVVWLASYPKSGNTWFRIVLENALSPHNEPININQLHHSRSVGSRTFLNHALGFDSRLLTQKELDQLRPSLHSWYAKQKRWFFKTHNAYFYLDYQAFHQCDLCLGALYFIRNPLDVAISFASHCHIPIDVSIQIMSNPRYITPSKLGLNQPIPERYLSWNAHVKTWKKADMNVLFTRYEDMVFRPFQTFQTLFEYLNIHLTPDRLQTILSYTHIQKLQQQEQQFGFQEKSQRQQDNFFRKGIVGDWEKTLTSRQISRILKHHDEMMFEFGYLDQHAQPIRYHTSTSVKDLKHDPHDTKHLHC